AAFAGTPVLRTRQSIWNSCGLATKTADLACKSRVATLPMREPTRKRERERKYKDEKQDCNIGTSLFDRCWPRIGSRGADSRTLGVRNPNGRYPVPVGSYGTLWPLNRLTSERRQPKQHSDFYD